MAVNCFIVILFVWYCCGHNISNTKDMPHKIEILKKKLGKTLMGKNHMEVVQDGTKVALQFKTTSV
jgi:hypothetical protein